MITVNNRQLKWEPGMNLQDVIEALRNTGRYDYILSKEITIVINGKAIEPQEYLSYHVDDKQVIHIVPQIMGG